MDSARRARADHRSGQKLHSREKQCSAESAEFSGDETRDPERARGAAVFTCGGRRGTGGRVAGGAARGARAVSIAGRGARRRARAGRRPAVRLGAASARSSPRPGVRRAGVSPRAPGGGGEPRAARPRPRPRPRPRAHALARASSAPPPACAPARRRARSLPAPPPLERPAPAPRLRPLFLWARQLDGTVQEVHCEDYDERNRLRIARTPLGWRVIPCTAVYDTILVPRAPVARRRRRARRPRRRAEAALSAPPAAAQPAWLAPDLESHIPSHTIAIPRAPSPPPPPSPPSPPAPPLPPSPPAAEPTPLDNLLAVAELEFNQQRTAPPELEVAAPFGFLPEDRARDVMSFELGEPKPAEMYFERKAPPEREEPAFPADLAAHKDLFETISEAHYLPELGGPHDEALLESLVEKGCEDNQILGQALDKLAHLVHGAGEYAEEEDDMLLGGAPVADIIDRLEHSLESPSRSSMTAAQGLLHLHHIGDHLPPDHQQAVDQVYLASDVFAQQPRQDCALEAIESRSQPGRGGHLEYESAEKRLVDGVEAVEAMYTDSVPDPHETYEKPFEDRQHAQSVPDQSEVAAPSDAPSDDPSANSCETVEIKTEENDKPEDQENVIPIATLDFKELEETSNSEPTDLSIKHTEKNDAPLVAATDAETMNTIEDNMSEKSDEQPKDLSLHRRLPTPHASPRRIDIPRAPSRESDAMQSPQPSGIPAVPSSPEIFTMPTTKSKQTLFLETLLSSPSPKMYTSEVTITKQQCEPLNLGKHRKSASPTVSSCSDEIKKLNKEFGEPQEKKIKRESDHISESRPKKPETTVSKSKEDTTSPYRQLQALKANPDFNIPDPLLVPKDKLNSILLAPAKEIPALMQQRPELRLPEAFAFPSLLQDPDILVISLSQLESILENNAKKLPSPPIEKEHKSSTPKSASSTEHTHTQAEQTSQPKPIPSMDALAGEIDAATSAALNQMMWLPYISQLEAMASCSQNMDFLKALNSSGYSGPNYPDLSQMFNPSGRFPMGPTGFPMMPQMDYDNRLQFAMWQEAMNHANAQASQRAKATSTSSSLEAQMKELASKSSDVQNPYVHSTKSHQSKSHSAARTSPIAHNYNTNQRSMNQNPFLQGMYPGMNPNIRPNMPLPGLQIPYFNPNLMGSQRSPRTGQQKSPTSPYYPNNNYLQSVKHSEAQHQRSSSTSSQESPRPRISVKSLQNLLEPTAAAASGVRRSNAPAAMGRRRDEPEVGSTTPLGEPPPHLPPHPHDPSSFHLWHPLFGNQKGYASPWSWTTVTATGD